MISRRISGRLISFPEMADVKMVSFLRASGMALEIFSLFGSIDADVVDQDKGMSFYGFGLFCLARENKGLDKGLLDALHKAKNLYLGGG